MSNKVDRALEVIKISIEQLWAKYARQAYENCEHKDKITKPCSKEQLCDKGRIVAWFWSNNARWN